MSKLTLLWFNFVALVYFLGASCHPSSTSRRMRKDDEHFHSSTSLYNHWCSPIPDGIHPIMRGVCSAGLLNAVRRACSDPNFEIPSSYDQQTNFEDDFYVRLEREEFIDEIADNEEEKKDALSMYDIIKVDPKVAPERSLWCDCCVHQCTAGHLRKHCNVLSRQISFQKFQELFMKHREYYDLWVPRNFDITPSSPSDEDENEGGGGQNAGNDVTSQDDYFVVVNLPHSRRGR